MGPAGKYILKLIGMQSQEICLTCSPWLGERGQPPEARGLRVAAVGTKGLGHIEPHAVTFTGAGMHLAQVMLQ